jgi:hypothetical protein
MFKNKFYEQAYKCFVSAGDEKLSERAKAHWYADSAYNELMELEAKKT